MSNLKNKAKKSKLSNNNLADKKEKLINKKREKILATSYFFSNETLNLIDETVARLNEISSKKISKTHFMKTAVLIASKMNTEMLFKAIKQIWY